MMPQERSFLCFSISGPDRQELSCLFDTNDSTLTICLYPHITFYADHGSSIPVISIDGVCYGRDLQSALGVPWRLSSTYEMDARGTT